ncbi:MAG: glyoxylate/hydroxypyruvate reductase A, partial [Paracoccus sp. (in: a-proteobacteria)]|nr:glyoxylate/hydroxypyruvate reductase A [Paracoccus sp. (in: a-proteobacteria)]
MRVLFAATDWEKWEAPLRAACPEADFVLDSAGEPVDAIIYAPGGPALDFRDYPGARLVQSLWAGVEKIAPDPHLTQPLARMVDPGLADGMAEYCAGWALRFHLGMDAQAQDG